jgi:hypothetical protein
VISDYELERTIVTLPVEAEENHENPQDSQSPGRDLNLIPPKYDARMITTQP